MTTRRSRLKAVANLPVRRKAPILQEDAGNVVNTVDNSSSANGSIYTGKSGCNTPVLSTIHHANEQQKVFPCLGNKNNSDSDYDSNIVVMKCGGSGDKESTISEPLTQESNVVVSSESNIAKDICVGNVNQIRTGSNSNLSCNGVVTHSLISSLSEEENFGELPITNTENDHCSIQTTVLCEIPSSVKENTNSTIITLENIRDSISTFDTPFSLCENENSIRSIISTNSNDALPETEESEPVLTTLVNCSNPTDINSFISSNESNLLTSQKESFINNICKDTAVLEIINYTENDCLPRSLINSTGEKTLADNLVYQDAQDITSGNICVNTTTKRNVAAVKRKRSKCSDFTKKLADARREFQKKYENTKPDRSTLKMIDLIFYNPSTNPMESKNKSDKKEPFLQDGAIQDSLGEEEIDEPQPLNCDNGLNSSDGEEMNLTMPVPQVKIGLNGEIILDEKSVIIETTEAKKGREDLIKNSVPIFEERGSKVSYYRGKSRKTRDWTDFETKRFYKALNTIGPDFSLMQKYFPKRSRMELKNKFKREERLNRSLIDKALINPSEFDMTQLEKDLAVEKKAEEREIEMKLIKRMKEKTATKRPRTKSSLFSREIIDCNEENKSIKISSNDVQKALEQHEKEKKEREIGSILRRYLLRDIKQDLIDNSEISASLT